MRYKWLAYRDTEDISKAMNRLAKRGYRMVGYGDNSSYWWALMAKDDGPVDEV